MPEIVKEIKDLPFDNKAQAAYIVQENRWYNKFIRKFFTFFNRKIPAKKIILELEGEFKSDGKFHLIKPLKLLENRKYVLVFPFLITTQKYEAMQWHIITSKQSTIDIVYEDMQWDITTFKQGTIDIVIDGK